MKKESILVIDDEEVMRDSCRQVLVRHGHEVATAANGPAGLELLAEHNFDLVMLDLKMPGLAGMAVLDRIKQAAPETIVVVITGHATIAAAVEAMKLGAYDLLPKPFTPDELMAIVNRALERRRLVTENFSLRGELQGLRENEFVMGPNAGMRGILNVIAKVAPTDSTVLITGESGTGKELIAQAIHRSSPRKDGPFIAVDCGSLVPTLFESELFGHVKGAFTDAIANKRGKLETADGGTVFFDEIGNIGPESQAKLLRALQEREFCRVGDTRSISFDARIIAATNQDLRKAVEARTFRDDLYYRINVVNLDLPPLRERKDDIPLLVSHFLKEYNRRRKRSVGAVSEAAMRLLLDYSWPGNIRELENVIERAVILCDGKTIEPWDFPFTNARARSAEAAAGTAEGTLEDVEKAHIIRVLKQLGGHRSRAAEALGVDRKTLRAKIKRYGIEETEAE
jgi:DNA-binding NtrC family response regulator